MRKTTDKEQEVLEFLNVLRDSGATNMFGAVPYIKDEFELDSKEAKSLLMLWMANFNDEGEYNEVKE
jgi:hypothetical protein